MAFVENAVAQMLRAAGHKLYFYSCSDREDASNRMEIDFLVSKSRTMPRHNVSPIEVKSGRKYSTTSLDKSNIPDILAKVCRRWL